MNNNPQQIANKGLFSLPPAINQMLPFVPLLIEQFTGQKIPQMTGTVAEIQVAIQQIQATLSQVINGQQQIFNCLTNLETNANNQLLSLDRRLENIQSLRLTHEKERKQIEYNPSKSLEREEY